MKEWKKEIIPYSELKKGIHEQLTHTNALEPTESKGEQSRYQSSALDSLLKSPEPSISNQRGFSGSILKNREYTFPKLVNHLVTN